MRNRTVIVAAVVGILAGFLLGTYRHLLRSDQSAKHDIQKALERWPRAFNDKDLDAVCSLFAPDVVLSYPGVPDRDYAAMRANFADHFARKDKLLRYDAPKIDSIQVSDDLAAVRLVWTLRVKPLDAEEAVTREQGVDVFRRQPDGRWKIVISHAYPLEEMPR